MRDLRTRKIRKKIRKVGKDLSSLQEFLEGLPADIRTDVQRQLQKAFEAGCAYSEIQHVPSAMPVDEQGIVQIGPALRYHIMQMRKVYGDIEQLREIVANIFDQKSQEMLRRIIREQEESVNSSNTAQLPL
ncbi:MAG: hypothetical protein KC680_04395 [Candidatus Peregrinibacteria bacterium]|nr:hypothetical protein [Candidatus Peregrinibacteria bacterium]MCB9808642.1 hypothetical protein [Candidatus Peribacteria bacterium]